MHVADYADGVLERREARRAFDRAPHVPLEGAATVLTINEKLQVGRLFMGDGAGLHVAESFRSTPF